MNLGTAVNSLCMEELGGRLGRADVWEHRVAWQGYSGMGGTQDLLETTAAFLQERLAKGAPVSPANLRLVNGVSAGLEVLAWVLADPGDLVIVPTPTYSRFFSDMNERMKTCVVGMELGEGFSLTADLLEGRISELKKAGGKVKAFLFCNPSNPLGVIYTRQLVLELMEVCKRHSIHFISDEIYALSVFDQSAEFSSVLSIPIGSLPDPRRTHVLWGLSKDLGLAGFRMGFVHSLSEEVLRSIDGMKFYTCVPAHIQQVGSM